MGCMDLTMTENTELIGIMSGMFAAYGKSGDAARIAVYCKVFEDADVRLLKKTVLKILAENKFVPTIADIMDAMKSLEGTMVESRRVKTWEEAWREINAKMYSTPWGRTPDWSTPEIAAAVDAYGWHNLHTSQESDMSAIRAQIRRFYEDACTRIAVDTKNKAVLGIKGGNILGIREGTNKLGELKQILPKKLTK